jgi:subtilisin-like proprotein convertase family protein
MTIQTNIAASTQGEWVIPDHTPEGVTSPIELNLKVTVASLKVHAVIEHPFVGDLTVNLIAPSGKTVTLQSRTGGSSDNIDTTYEGAVLEPFEGEDVNGTWHLQAIDHATRDTGAIKSWSIDAECNVWFHTAEIESVVEETVASDEDAAATGIDVVATAPVDEIVVDETVATDEDAAATGIDVVAVAPVDEVMEHEEPTPDNLKEIEGIGPKIEELLNHAGIMTFAQLAASSVETLQGILDEAGSAFNRHEPTTWAQQAQLAANGQWDELRAWQDELDGGRVVEAEAEEEA